MKNLILTLAILFMLSCSSDENGTTVDPGSNSAGTMLAKIDNFTWSASSVKAFKQSNFITLEGSQNLPESSEIASIKITIIIKNVTQPTLLGIGEDGGGFIYNASSTVEYNYRNNSQTDFIGQYVENFSLIEITDLNDTFIKGTFEFRASDKGSEPELIDIEDGRFQITF